MSDTRNEFTAGEIVDLLSELDKRLKTRGISASVFVVGGAAIAVTSNDNPRRTEDIDAITRDEAVVDEAHAMASQRKLPEDWLNTRASPWMPPLPEGALQRSDAPGLHITYATDEFLLATKLVAQRRKDAADIVALAKRLHMENASADDLEQLIYRYYTDEPGGSVAWGVGLSGAQAPATGGVWRWRVTARARPARTQLPAAVRTSGV